MIAKLCARLRHFFFTPDDGRALAIFRICLGIMLLVEALLTFSSWQDLYGPRGFLDATLMRAISGRNLPAYASLFEGWGLSYGSLLYGLFGVRAAAILFFLAGAFTRPATLFLWITQVILMASGPLSSYGLDRYFHVFLFLLLFFPAGAALSFDAARGRMGRFSPWAPRFGLRLLQLALLITYFNAGAAKAIGPEWWSGDAIWRVLHLPEFTQGSFLWLARYPIVPKLLGWSTFFFETFYVVGVWIPYVGALWLLAIISMHLGIVLFMNLTNFGLGMALFNAALFGYPKARAYFSRPEGRRRLVAIVGRVFPHATARWAGKIFRRTRRYPRPAWETALAAEGEAIEIRPGFKALRFLAEAEAPRILLVHGWAGRGTQLGAFVAPLRAAGFSVLTFDGPGHGEAPGEETDLGELEAALAELDRRCGPFRGTIAHSFGAMASALAVSRGARLGRLVLIGAPSQLEGTFLQFARELGLPPRAFRIFQRAAEERAGVRVAGARIATLGQGSPALVIHDEADEIVPIAQAEETLRAWPGAKLLRTKGLGHRRILKAPEVLRAAVEFLSRES